LCHASGDRTITRKYSIGGFVVLWRSIAFVQGKLDILKIDKNSTDLMFHVLI